MSDTREHQTDPSKPSDYLKSMFHNPWSDRPWRKVMNDSLPSNTLVYHLLANGFITGLLDATTYADYTVFTSNQTGNTVLLGVGAVGAASVTLRNTGISLAAFAMSALTLGQVAVRVHPSRGRTRWWVLCTSTWQWVSIVVIAALEASGVIDYSARWAWLVILLFGSSAGAQVAMARQFNVPEVPTAMLTSPFVDLFTDPYLFSRTFTRPENRARTRRVSYITAFIIGIFVGAGIHRRAGSRAVVLLAAILKFCIFLSFWFTAGEEENDCGKSREGNG